MWIDLIQVLRDLKMNYKTKTDLIQASRDSKITYTNLLRIENDLQQKSDLIQVSRDLKMTHPSLERLENDLSKSWETWKWLIKLAYVTLFMKNDFMWMVLLSWMNEF